MRQHLGRDAFRQRLQQVVAAIGKPRRDRARQHVVAEDPVHLIAAAADGRGKIGRHVEAQALGHAPLGLEGADLGQGDVIAQVDAVGLVHRPLMENKPRLRKARGA